MTWTKRQVFLASLVFASSLLGALLWTPLLLGILLPRFLLPGSTLLGLFLDLLPPALLGSALLAGALLLPEQYFEAAFAGVWILATLAGWRTLWSGSRHEAEALAEPDEGSLLIRPR